MLVIDPGNRASASELIPILNTPVQAPSIQIKSQKTREEELKKQEEYLKKKKEAAEEKQRIEVENQNKLLQEQEKSKENKEKVIIAGVYALKETRGNFSIVYKTNQSENNL